jgi:hypothetical protein
MPDIACATVPGHPLMQSPEELERNILSVTLDEVVANLTVTPASARDNEEPGPRDIVFRGGFTEVNDQFVARQWSDGLPIVPPTRERVAAFLSFTTRDPDEVLGILLPDQRAATVWNVAVNGVMAGCRPEYMPILLALVEAMADPAYGVEHSGNTPGGETLIMLNGPIIGELGFNCEQGVLRDGFLPNTSIGRFWRLYLRNVAGFLLHQTDKATFGNTWRVVMAENEAVLRSIGWPAINVDMGFAAGTNTVTVARYTGGNLLASVTGSDPQTMLPYLALGVRQQVSWHVMFTLGMQSGSLRPLILLSPILARTIAAAGWSKRDVQDYLFEHVRMPAWEFERQLRDWNPKPVWNLAEEVALGHLPAVFHVSDDPQRLVPLVWKPEDYMIAVTGDPDRNNAYVFAHNGVLGFPTTKNIDLPADWASRLPRT